MVKAGVAGKEVWADNPVIGDGWGIPLHRGSNPAHCPWGGCVPGTVRGGSCSRKSIAVRTEWKLRVDGKTLVSHPGDSLRWFPFPKEGDVAAPVEASLVSWSPWAQLWTRVGKGTGGGDGSRLGRCEHTPLPAPRHLPPRCDQMWPCPSCSRASRYHRDDSDMEQGWGCCPCVGCDPTAFPGQQVPWRPTSSKEGLDLDFAMQRVTPSSREG